MGADLTRPMITVLVSKELTTMGTDNIGNPLERLYGGIATNHIGQGTAFQPQSLGHLLDVEAVLMYHL